ncbi:hypothetical protein AYI70_g7413, partial [Smittium culicis]
MLQSASGLAGGLVEK